MAWTTPKSWVAGEMVTHTLLNTHQKDNISLTVPGVLSAKGSVAGASGANAMADRPVGTNGDYLESDSAHASGLGWVTGVLESGTIGLFDGACPSGWTEYTASQGRYIVGTPSGGTDEATVGTALTDKQDKTHTHITASHTHSLNTGAALGNSQSNEPPLDTDAGGVGTTGTAAAASDILPYIQFRVCKKD